jgi:type IV secretion system protein TrbL
MASGTKSAYQAGAAASGSGGVRAAGAGVANVAKSGAGAVGQRVAAGAKAVKDRVANFVAEAAAPAAAAGSTESANSTEAKPPTAEPAWAKQMRRKQQVSHAATTAAHTLRSGDHGGSGASPSLRDESNV